MASEFDDAIADAERQADEIVRQHERDVIDMGFAGFILGVIVGMAFAALMFYIASP